MKGLRRREYKTKELPPLCFHIKAQLFIPHSQEWNSYRLNDAKTDSHAVSEGMVGLQYTTDSGGGGRMESTRNSTSVVAWTRKKNVSVLDIKKTALEYWLCFSFYLWLQATYSTFFLTCERGVMVLYQSGMFLVSDKDPSSDWLKQKSVCVCVLLLLLFAIVITVNSFTITYFWAWILYSCINDRKSDWQTPRLH